MMTAEVQDKLGPVLSQVASQLDGPDRRRISEAMGEEVRALFVRHFRQLADTRHATANRLGANPTNYLAQLHENFDQVGTVEVDEDGVSISLRHPVVTRALRDVTIRPRSGQYLTIPLNAAAYGKRAGELAGRVVFFKKGEGKSSGDEKKPRERRPIPEGFGAYLLVRSVTQKRDPSLIPDLDSINTAAAKGAGSEIRAILAEAQRL